VERNIGTTYKCFVNLSTSKYEQLSLSDVISPSRQAKEDAHKEKYIGIVIVE
jgi:hypothetical protein